jgi:hypothetical protein
MCQDNLMDLMIYEWQFDDMQRLKIIFSSATLDLLPISQIFVTIKLIISR